MAFQAGLILFPYLDRSYASHYLLIWGGKRVNIRIFLAVSPANPDSHMLSHSLPAFR